MADQLLEGLNAEQRQAARHDNRPLLIIAGAGTGKTTTLVHRVAQLIDRGISPERIMLLTFTRRAAAEMLRRVGGLLQQHRRDSHGSAKKRQVPAGKVWGGTFHATGAHLLRLYGKAIGLRDGFPIHDRSDAEDLLDVVRSELDLAKGDKRFPKKGTCLGIYSHRLNTGHTLGETLAEYFPWCADHAEALRH